MKIEGGCYCKEVRYEAEGDIGLRGQCFCRECQYTTGGDSLFVIGMPEAGFRVTKGELAEFRRSDLENPVTRQFCANCGTQIVSLAMPGMVLIKVGTLDDPSVFEGPQMAIYTCDKQGYHRLDPGVTAFDRLPG